MKRSDANVSWFAFFSSARNVQLGGKMGLEISLFDIVVLRNMKALVWQGATSMVWLSCWAASIWNQRWKKKMDSFLLYAFSALQYPTAPAVNARLVLNAPESGAMMERTAGAVKHDFSPRGGGYQAGSWGWCKAISLLRGARLSMESLWATLYRALASLPIQT